MKKIILVILGLLLIAYITVNFGAEIAILINYHAAIMYLFLIAMIIITLIIVIRLIVWK
jgi:hypothetical protein